MSVEEAIVNIVYAFISLYKQAGQRKVSSFSFFLFSFVGTECYRSSNVCVVECNCSCFMHQFSSAAVTRAANANVA